MKKLLLLLLITFSLPVGAVECPPEKPIRLNSGTCISCDSALISKADQKERCLKCLKGFWTEYSPHECHLEYPCESGFIFGTDNSKNRNGEGGTKCFSCDSKLSIRPTYEDDLSCQNRETRKSVYHAQTSVLRQCPPDKPLKTWSGCRLCSEEVVLELFDEKDNEVCPNRRVEKRRNYISSIFSCPSDKPLKTKDGCKSCDSLDVESLIWEANETEKNVCANRENLDVYYPRGEFSNTKTINLPKNCPVTAPLRTVIGCVSCNSKEQQYSVPSLHDCEACPGWQSRSKYNHTICAYPCSLGQIFAATDNFSWRCISCDEKFLDDISQNDCQKCSNRIWDPKTKKCNFKTSLCGEEEALVEMKNSFYKCISCKEPYIEGFTKKECQKCPNYRFWNEEKQTCDFKESPYPDRPIIVKADYLWFSNNAEKGNWYNKKKYDFKKIGE